MDTVMKDQVPPEVEQVQPSFALRYGRLLRQYFVAGLATLFPLAFTVWLVVQIFRAADSFLGRSLGVQLPGLGILVTCVIILVVGFLSVHVVGRLLLQTLEGALSRLPLIRRIYPAVKQIAAFFFSGDERAGSLRRVVLVEFPKVGTFALAFVTNEQHVSFKGKPERWLTLLVSNPPSPLSGPIIFVPEEQVITLSMSVEEALKIIVSGGVVGSPLVMSSQPIN